MEAEQATTEAPAETQDQPAVETTPAPEATSVTDDQPTTDTETPESAEESFTKFRLADVPEEHREYVETAYKQLHGDYTRKTQEVAEQRKSAQQALELADLLNTPEGQAQIFRQLAELQGYELDDGNADETDEPDLDDLPLEEQLAARVDQLERAIRAKEEAERTSAEKAEEDAVLAKLEASCDTQLEALTDANGGEPLDKGYADAVVSHALAAFPPDENGMPQIRKAYDALEAEWKRRESKWAASKDTPHVSTAGQSASQVPSTDTHEDRVQFMVDKLQGAAGQ